MHATDQTHELLRLGFMRCAVLWVVVVPQENCICLTMHTFRSGN
jgi:hypothetical protein